VYLGAPGAIPDGVQFPPRALVAFDRVRIPAGAAKTVKLHVPLRQLEYWSTKEQQWVTASGPRTLSVGSSSRSLLLHAEIGGSQM
jgi:beta-glucosidase